MLEAPSQPPAEVPAAPPTAPAVTHSPPVSSPWRRRCRWVVVLSVAYGLWEVFWTLLGANFHTVIPDRVYRSAQPSARELRNFVKHHGIKTVINLRGCCPLFSWYQEASKTAQDLGLAQEDVNLSAKRLPSATEIRRLVEVLENSAYPVLLHCKRGADRTGLASVLALVLLTDVPYEQARAALGWRFGHIPLGGTETLDEFFVLYEAWLQRLGEVHSRERFRHWIMNEYDGGWCRQRFLEVRLAYAGSVSYVGDAASVGKTPLLVQLGQPLAFQVKLLNPGPGVWDFQPHSVAGMHLGYEVRDQDNKEVQFGRAGMMRRAVRPGEIIDLMVLLAPLRQSGRHRVRLDMIEEGHCWFQQAGAEPFELELDVRE